MQVKQTEILMVAQLVEDLCGVVLDETKGYLIESRLGSLVKAIGSDSFADFCRKARLPANRRLTDQIIDAITTNETLFFRDSSPFEALKHKAIPETIDAKAKTAFPKRLRIWSAACSTGQEVYSIAMTLHELLPDLSTWDIQILGTDISDAAVKQASLGRYAEHEISRGMSPILLQKYFRREANGWRVKDELRFLATFQRRNLLQPFADTGVFDIVFCRNVAIYFEEAAKRSLFCRLANQLTPNGYLFVGSSESLVGVSPQFVPQNHCRAVFYQPNMTVGQPNREMAAMRA